jgi:hypothetical protein
MSTRSTRGWPGTRGSLQVTLSGQADPAWWKLVEAVRQRTISRYLSLTPDADPEVADKFGCCRGAAANVGGIWHWLDKLEEPAA